MRGETPPPTVPALQGPARAHPTEAAEPSVPGPSGTQGPPYRTGAPPRPVSPARVCGGASKECVLRLDQAEQHTNQKDFLSVF